MSSIRHVALLRGINVGGNNVIRMADLRACFEAMGFTAVATYIQSGNVVFSSKRPASGSRLVSTIERTLGETFGAPLRIVLVSPTNLARIVSQAPPGFGMEPDRYRYDVLFVRAPVTPAEALAQIATKPGVDEVRTGDHVLYFRRLISRASQSRLSKIVQQPVYKDLTIRNWNTTIRLLAMVTT
jgi:uncharacterized protein (DUF1697 family)